MFVEPGATEQVLSRRDNFSVCSGSGCVSTTTHSTVTSHRLLRDMGNTYNQVTAQVDSSVLVSYYSVSYHSASDYMSLLVSVMPVSTVSVITVSVMSFIIVSGILYSDHWIGSFNSFIYLSV